MVVDGEDESYGVWCFILKSMDFPNRCSLSPFSGCFAELARSVNGAFQNVL